LLAELPGPHPAKWCRLMRFKREDTEKIISCLEEVPMVIEVLKHKKPPPSVIVGLLDPLKREALAYLYALGGEKARKTVRTYVETWHNLEPEISGEDLKKMGLKPSRVYGEILSRVRADVLDGKIKGKKEELELARRLVKQKMGASRE
jgi:tRNA nucleotidyltransferase/poly(A) polymerase